MGVGTSTFRMNEDIEFFMEPEIWDIIDKESREHHERIEELNKMDRDAWKFVRDEEQ